MTPPRTKTSASFVPVDAWGAGACLVMTLIAYFAGVAPLRRHHVEAHERRQSLAELTQHAGELSTHVRQLTGRLTSVQRSLAENPLRLQPSSQLNRRLAEITSAAGSSGLQVNDIQPGKLIQGARHMLIPIDLAGAGSYRDCVEFLHQFHATFTDSGVASFALARNPSEPSSTTSFQFTLIWYVEPQSASAR